MNTIQQAEPELFHLKEDKLTPIRPGTVLQIKEENGLTEAFFEVISNPRWKDQFVTNIPVAKVKPIVVYRGETREFFPVGDLEFYLSHNRLVVYNC